MLGKANAADGDQLTPVGEAAAGRSWPSLEVGSWVPSWTPTVVNIPNHIPNHMERRYDVTFQRPL